jgi:hypothetical protein
MLQHGDDFATPVDLDDLIVRREQIALLSVSEGGEEKEDKKVGLHAECLIEVGGSRTGGLRTQTLCVNF